MLVHDKILAVILLLRSKRKQEKKQETKTIQKGLKSKYIKENKYNKIRRKQQKKIEKKHTPDQKPVWHL